ncbi:hypothetical protein QTJ16_006584 [Diplocarpon rosae]|uniref:Uncharacterized protein n=1 Tax=Diplocarpon rosae TaxID=946125 RepID=A0AAD9SUH1_9HELO|nr:hypothetical protein QTJ16_006584 [Diplocarpon rosae]
MPAELASPHGFSGTFSILDMELLHHFNNYTFSTFATESIVHETWHKHGPTLGFQFPFLLRGILSFAALHLGHVDLRRRETLTNYAARLHAMAADGAGALLPQVTAENCSALHMFACLECFSQLGRLDKSSGAAVQKWRGVGVATGLECVTGMRLMLQTSARALYSGPLGPMLKVGEMRNIVLVGIVRTGPQFPHFSELRDRLSRHQTNDGNYQVYIDTVGILESVFEVISSTPFGNREVADLLIGLFNLPEDYVGLVKENRQEALVIFAYLCVLFRYLETYWWLQGVAAHFMTQLYQVLDEEHREWIRWPMEHLNWTPPPEIIDDSTGTESGDGEYEKSVLDGILDDSSSLWSPVSVPQSATYQLKPISPNC